MKTNEPSLPGSESVEGKVACKTRSVFFEGEQNKKGSNLQAEICVDVDERAERLVRCTHLRREDGDT